MAGLGLQLSALALCHSALEPGHGCGEPDLQDHGWELQAKSEHLDDTTLTGELYLQHILEILDIRPERSKALFEGSRKSDESVAQFAVRREQEFCMAERYVTLPRSSRASCWKSMRDLVNRAPSIQAH